MEALHKVFFMPNAIKPLPDWWLFPTKLVAYLFRVELRGSSEARTEQAHLSEAKMSEAKRVIAKQA